MKTTQSLTHFQSQASVNSYESILNRYKTKKDLMARVSRTEE